MAICYLREFGYVKGKPIITVKLSRSNDSESHYFELLLDSGADYTMIAPTLASTLGIEYEELEGPEKEVEAANLGIIKTKIAKLTLQIDHIVLSVPVMISKTYIDSLLGRKGLFDVFDICFKQSQNKIIFTKAG